MQQLIKKILSASGRIEYHPSSMDGVVCSIGAPPSILNGVDYVFAYRNTPKAKLFKCFTQEGAFVSNRNLSGYIEIGVMAESTAAAMIQVVDLTGINFPVYCMDTGTKGSAFIAATKARVINTPAWRKSKDHGITVYTMEAPRLMISGGMRNISTS